MTYSSDYKKDVIKNCNKIGVNKCNKLFSCSKSSIYNWQANKYIQNNKTRKSKFTPLIKCVIRKYVITKVNFNYKKLIIFLKNKFHIAISKSSIYNILSKMKIKKKKIYKKHIYLNKRKMNKLKKEFKKQILKTPTNSIISIDETSIDSEINYNYGWNESGKRIYKEFTKQKIRYTLICAINTNKIIHTKLIKNSANANDYVEFTKELLSKLDKNRQYILLQDNCRIHHSKIYKKYIQPMNNIKPLYNVPYSPEYNPIEYIFNDIKRYIRGKIITTKNIKKIINYSLNTIKSKNIKQYYRKSLSF